MPIFQDLSKPELLQKCLHGGTQNNNEAINQFLWQRIPKAVYIGFYTFEIGMCSTVLSFNSGATGLLDVFRELKMEIGYFVHQFCSKKDNTRIKKMERQMSSAGKASRNRKRAVRKGYTVRDEEAEGTVYATGMF